jgi:peptidoglycan/xylan/chitin deacetylase (PgdA/CDA1 family)
MGAPQQGARRVATFAMAVVVVVSSHVPWAEPGLAATTCAAGHVALTFDDGPHPTYTAPILEVLARKEVPATFFVVGARADAHPALVRRQAAAGHVVANHTYRHERLTSLSDADIVRTVDRTHTAIGRAGAVPARLVRPPYGASSTRVREVLAGAGYTQVLWTVDPRDWEHTASAIRSRVLADVHDGAIVLLHDGVTNSGETLAALPGLIDGIRSRGYCFGSLDARGRVVPPAPLVPHAPPVPPGPFADVPSTSTHAASITSTKALGITQGCGVDRYCPADPVSRAQMASFLTRAFGLPAGPIDVFRDVEPDSTHATSIGSVFGAGITEGCRADGPDYCPLDPVSRAQMASFLARTLELPDGPSDAFVDVAPGSPHAAAIGATQQAGITQGCSTAAGTSTFCPDQPVTRAQMASFLVRALGADGGA